MRYSLRPIKPLVDSVMCSPRAKVDVNVAKNMNKAEEMVLEVKASLVQSDTRNFDLPGMPLEDSGR